MFLDEELRKIVDDTPKEDFLTPQGVQDMYKKLCEKCENHYKEKMKKGGELCGKKETKAILNQTFNSWTLFTKNLKKEGSKTYTLLAELLDKMPFKDQFLAHPEMNRIYKSL